MFDFFILKMANVSINPPVPALLIKNSDFMDFKLKHKNNWIEICELFKVTKLLIIGSAY